MSGLSYYHKIRLLPDPFQSFPVRQLFQALKKVSPSFPDTRRPVSENLLLLLVDKLQLLGLSFYETTLFSTMFLFAFYFGLRISEYTSSQHNLKFENVQVSANSVVINFHSYKHSRNQSLPHFINRTHLRHCPVLFANKYISMRSATQGSFFVLNNKPISARKFSNILKQLILLLDLPPQFYSAHSFRIGAATHWFSKNFSEQRIRQLGRWSSNAFLSYIRSFINHST